VNPAPIPRFTEKNVCLGDTMNFADSSVNAGSFLWHFGDSSAQNTSLLKSPKHLFAHADTYTVKLKLTSLSGCSDSVSHQAQVYPLPSADWTFTYNRFDYHFLATDSSLADYTWVFGDSSRASGYKAD